MTSENKGTAINESLETLIIEKKRNLIADVDEATFKHKLLPMAVARYSNVDYDVPLTGWALITGHPPYHGVRVMRDGEPIFTTPPLILSPKIEFERGSLLQRLSDGEKKEKAGLPKDEIMDEGAMGPTMHIDRLHPALSTWMAIFRLYGIKLIVDDGVEPEPPAKIEDAVQQQRWEDDDDGDIL